MREPAPTNPGDRLPAVVSETPSAPAGKKAPAAAAFDAQLLGQGGARRGLRGGAPVLDAAQQTYLETEWSGPSDRRAPQGRTRREDI